MLMREARQTLLGLAMGVLAACATAVPVNREAPQVPSQASSADWERDMQRFAEADATAPPPRDAVLFIGSSSIRFWETLAADFPGIPTLNRGFGGSHIRDSTWYADRIIVPYSPRRIVFYAGENDLDAGRSPRQVRDDFRGFVQRVRQDLPETPIAYISSKPSPLRMGQLEAQRQANALVREDIAAMDRVEFIDVFTPMLDTRGRPRGELFINDGLHLSRAGYELWKRIVTPYLQ